MKLQLKLENAANLTGTLVRDLQIAHTECDAVVSLLLLPMIERAAQLQQSIVALAAANRT